MANSLSVSSFSSQDVVNTAQALDNVIRTGTPLKVAAKDFSDLMLRLLFAVAQGSGTVDIDGQQLDVTKPGTIELANIKIDTASSSIQFILKQLTFINDLNKQVGQIS